MIAASWSVWRPMSCCLALSIKRIRIQARRISTSTPSRPKVFEVSESIRSAIHQGRPTVALETTIYTHGLPHPQNLELSRQISAAIIDEGAIPCHIGVVGGTAKVGLSWEEVERLCIRPRHELVKFSRRDLPFLAEGDLKRQYGGTTVAATMFLAHKAGLRIFATGGIGGVHRGAETSFDISADLVELGRTPVVVVCSGCKGFLDIPKTLEFLETHGVPVTTLTSNTEADFPAFWSISSGVGSPKTACGIKAAAHFIENHFAFKSSSGMLIANPISQRDEIPQNEMRSIIEEALSLATQQDIIGKDNTPFVLDKIKSLSGDRSVKANSSLVINNTRAAARIAVELATNRESSKPIHVFNETKQLDATEELQKHANITCQQPEDYNQECDVVVAGSIALDYGCDHLPCVTKKGNDKIVHHTSNITRITNTVGGVGYNVARAAQSCGARVRLMTKLGGDIAGEQIRESLFESKFLPKCQETILVDKWRPTAQYIAINDADKQLVIGAADMSIFENCTDADKIIWAEQLFKVLPKVIVIDANWSPDMISFWIDASQRLRTVRQMHVVFEAVSVAKAVRLVPAIQAIQALQTQPSPMSSSRVIDYLAVNELELGAIWSAARDASMFAVADGPSSAKAEAPTPQLGKEGLRKPDPRLAASDVVQKCVPLLSFCHYIMVSLGARGMLLVKARRMAIDSTSDHKHDGSEPSTKSMADIAPQTVQHSHGADFIHYPARTHLRPEEIVNVNGAGDTQLGATVAAISRGYSDHHGINPFEFGQDAACLTLRSAESVSPKLASLLHVLSKTSDEQKPAAA